MLSYLNLKVVCRHIWGALQYGVVGFAMAIHIGPRPIYLVRAGECENDHARAAVPAAAFAPVAAVVAAASQPSGRSAGVRSISRQESTPIMPTAATARTPSCEATGSDAFTPVLPPPSLRPTADGDTVDIAVAHTAGDSTAPSAGLHLNARGRAFAVQLAAFIGRRTFGGRPSADLRTSLAAGGGGGAHLHWDTAAGTSKRRMRHRLVTSKDVSALEPTSCDEPPLLDESDISVAHCASLLDAHYASASALPPPPLSSVPPPPTTLPEPRYEDVEVTVFDAPPAVFTSTLPRTIETAASLPVAAQPLSALNPMEMGICLGVPLCHLRTQFPEEWRRWRESPDRVRESLLRGCNY